MKQYKHIFWDLDHTLWDFEKNSVAALSQVYIQFELVDKGISDFDEFSIRYHAHNDKYWERFRKGFITREVMRWKRMYATMMDYKIVNEKLASEMGEAYLEYLPLQTNVFENAIEILDYCAQKGIQQHIITNGFEGTQIQKMTNSNMLHFFDAIVTSEKAMSLKPHAPIYEFAFAKTGATNQDSIMIGDAIDVDVLGAMNVGMDAVWFNPNGLVSEQERTYEVKEMKELFAIFK
jgi:putative hydrolase of the HAD superfamily